MNADSRGTAASVLNISAYLFTRIADPAALRPILRERALTRELLGTIIVAEEGINMFLAGDADGVRGFVADLQQDERFAALTTKESWSATQPFRKMLVKHKREIIRMDRPTIRPASGRAPAVDPVTLRRWLRQGVDDAGREVVLLDTRNAFEVDHGTFDGALDWRLEKFTESVRMYEMRPTVPSSPIATPSYSFCATCMVLQVVKPSLREASCCRVEVVNGGAGRRLRSLLATSVTCSEPCAACWMRRRAASAVAAVGFIAKMAS